MKVETYCPGHVDSKGQIYCSKCYDVYLCPRPIMAEARDVLLKHIFNMSLDEQERPWSEDAIREVLSSFPENVINEVIERIREAGLKTWKQIYDHAEVISPCTYDVTHGIYVLLVENLTLSEQCCRDQ